MGSSRSRQQVPGVAFLLLAGIASTSGCVTPAAYNGLWKKAPARALRDPQVVAVAVTERPSGAWLRLQAELEDGSRAEWRGDGGSLLQLEPSGEPFPTRATPCILSPQLEPPSLGAYVRHARPDGSLESFRRPLDAKATPCFCICLEPSPPAYVVVYRLLAIPRRGLPGDPYLMRRDKLFDGVLSAVPFDEGSAMNGQKAAFIALLPLFVVLDLALLPLIAFAFIGFPIPIGAVG
jgi:hypothetical protein